MPAIWKIEQWSQDWKRSVFIPIPKKGNAKECSSYPTNGLISQASKVMLQILQANLQQCINHGLPDVQAGFRKGRGNRSNCHCLMDHRKNKRVPEKHLLLLMDYINAFDCVNHKNLWKGFQETGIPDHLSCLLRNLYVVEESVVTTRHGTIYWFQIGKGVQ